MSFTFDDLVKIFTRLCQDGAIKQSGYEMACLVLDCWASMQKQEHIREAQNRYVPSERKG